VKYIFNPFLLLIFVITACDPCTDCGPLAYEPTVELSFVDAEIADELLVETVATDLTIYWENVSSLLEFEEGETAFIAPLSYLESESEYTVTINGTDYSLVLDYVLDKQLDINRRIIYRALNIDSVSHSFDSLVFECGSFGCLDKQTVITCYF
jgi:hypothetical protein